MKWRRRERHFIRTASLWLCCFGATFAAAQDLQSWNEVDLTASWRNIEFLVPLLARVDSSLPNPQLVATGVMADLPLRWHLTFTGGYLFAVVPQRPLNVHLPIIALTPTLKVRHFVLADRNRFEKLIGFTDSPVRYRNRFLLDAPFGARERWHVFLDDEIIFNVTD